MGCIFICSIWQPDSWDHRLHTLFLTPPHPPPLPQEGHSNLQVHFLSPDLSPQPSKKKRGHPLSTLLACRKSNLRSVSDPCCAFTPLLGVLFNRNEVFQFNIKTLAQLFLNGRDITYFSFKCGLMNCMNCMTMTRQNLLNPCLISKYGRLEAVTFTFSVPVGSFNPLSPGRSKGDPAGKSWICKNISNLLRLCPSLWNILKFNSPSLFH